MNFIFKKWKGMIKVPLEIFTFCLALSYCINMWMNMWLWADSHHGNGNLNNPKGYMEIYVCWDEIKREKLFHQGKKSWSGFVGS